MVDSEFMVCSVRLPVVDGTGVFVVWWSVMFVFRIVDGTGMFECFFLVVERVDLICCVRELDNAICEFPTCVPCFG